MPTSEEEGNIEPELLSADQDECKGQCLTIHIKNTGIRRLYMRFMT